MPQQIIVSNSSDLRQLMELVITALKNTMLGARCSFEFKMKTKRKDILELNGDQALELFLGIWRYIQENPKAQVVYNLSLNLTDLSLHKRFRDTVSNLKPVDFKGYSREGLTSKEKSAELVLLLIRHFGLSRNKLTMLLGTSVANIHMIVHQERKISKNLAKMIVETFPCSEAFTKELEEIKDFTRRSDE